MSGPSNAGNQSLVEAIHLQNYPAFAWRDKLVIKQTAKSFFDPEVAEKTEKLTAGIHLHTVLSRIHYAHDVDIIMNQIVSEGLITLDEKNPLLLQLNEILSLPQVSPWFSPEWEVRTEVPILLPNGAENRIDRLLTQGKKAIVIDFKTGEILKADQTQVLAYMDILRKMNFIDVEGYLLYIRHKQIVTVSNGKVKVSKKKDENQTALEF